MVTELPRDSVQILGDPEELRLLIYHASMGAVTALSLSRMLSRYVKTPALPVLTRSSSLLGLGFSSLQNGVND